MRARPQRESRGSAEAPHGGRRPRRRAARSADSTRTGSIERNAAPTPASPFANAASIRQVEEVSRKEVEKAPHEGHAASAACPQISARSRIAG